jgi:hypothetical protein
MSSRKPNRPRGNKSKLRREAAARKAGKAPALPDDRTREPGYQRDWVGSRKGADASRGFQFQHAVGALLAVRIADGTLDGTLIPESLDDMVIEAAGDTNAQIKSRNVNLGPFPAATAAQHIINAWKASHAKTTKPHVQWVVLEGGVETPEPLMDLTQPLGDVLRPGSELHTALVNRAARELNDEVFADLLARTRVFSDTWDAIDAQTLEHIGSLHPNIDRAGRMLMARSVQVEIATVTSRNTTRSAEERETLNRTRVLALLGSAAELIDVEGLSEALRTGVCSLLDWSAGADAGDSFYEGESTRPGHVASGLVIERPDLLDRVISGTEQARPVVLTGPSGVGKSAVLWTIPRALRGVTWLRVERLESDEDANVMMRLARSLGASVQHPVGFLVDGAGAGQLTRWDLLRARAAATDGVLLFATVRNEDLVQLGSFAGTETVDVVLDERSAEAIFAGLQRRGATEAPHWKEAFESSNGLTLEFTYLLTHGKRLQEVIGDQIYDRVQQNRSDELELLGLVTVAHQWGATPGLERVAETLGAAGTALRTPIRRLAKEHLLVETDGVLSGLHQVRSTAISDAIHSTPPPLLRSTFSLVLRTIDDGQLPRFITSALRDNPDLADVVLEVVDPGSVTARRLASFLQGLRLADSEHAIREWLTIVEEEGIKRASHLTVVMLALAGSDMGPATPPTIRAALDRMATVEPGHRRDALADRIGAEAMSALVFNAEPVDAQALLATLHGWDGTLAMPADPGSAPLVRALAASDLRTLTEVISTVHDFDAQLGVDLIGALGGEDEMLVRIRAEEPWLLEAEIRESPDGPIGYARMLHVSDEAQENPRDRCVALARSLLRLLPSIVEPDVEALWPGRRRIEVGGHAFALSGLLRQYDHNQTAVAWNQARNTIAQALLGVPDSVRLAAAEPILKDLATWFSSLTNRWARGEFPGTRDAALLQEGIRLDDAGYAMAPGLGRGDVDLGAITHTTKTSMLDRLPTAITDVTAMFLRLRDLKNPTGEAMYVRNQLTDGLRSCLGEPWHLIADGDRAIESLNSLISTARLLAEVLAAHGANDAARPATRRAARGGPSGQALRRAAESARRLQDSDIDGRCREIADAVAAAAPGCDIDVRADQDASFTRFAVLVEGPPVYEFSTIEGPIVAAVQALNVTLDKFLILPTRQRKRFDQVGVSVIQSPLPALSVEGWEELVPEAHSRELADLVQTVFQELQILSGIGELSEEGQSRPEVLAVAEAAVASCKVAFDALAHLDNDFTRRVVEIAAEVARRVDEEDPSTGEETFAAALIRGLSGNPTEELLAVTVLTLCALEWPINEHGVHDLLDL